MNTYLVLLVYPFALIYGFFVDIIGVFYKTGLFSSKPTAIFSLGIGNITVGGTGKTPHTEYFIRLFEKENKIATLSRGYGRKTTGFLAVDISMGPEKVGDEPWQFFLKFGDRIKVTVGEKRVPASKKIHALYPEVDLLLLDDVFQHRAIRPDYMILLCDYNRPFFFDYPFPAGRLREFRRGARRADHIIVSKCKADMPAAERAAFRAQLAAYAPHVPVAFSSITYGSVVPVYKTVDIPTQWLLVTGIAQPQPLVDHLQAQGSLLAHKAYADHHELTFEEALEVLSAYKSLAKGSTGVLLTEKDYARLSPELKELWKDLPLFYIPITVVFLEGETLLLQNIQQAMDRRAAFPIN